MAPPSYAAAVGEKETNIADDKDQHTFGNLKYVPVYTYAQPYQVNIRQLLLANYSLFKDIDKITRIRLLILCCYPYK